jgi:hypothetical protein
MKGGIYTPVKELLILPKCLFPVNDGIVAHLLGQK